jgi:hypothetical protein
VVGFHQQDYVLLLGNGVDGEKNQTNVIKNTP